MSEAKNHDAMRPIPDGGLKDAMPAWLKRPPAWRTMPTAEQRRERALPEPDTSPIDPRSLVDLTDLPQWLQTIAARGEIPVPIADTVADHAIEQLQRATESEATSANDPEPAEAPAIPAAVVVSAPEFAPAQKRSGSVALWVIIAVLVLAVIILGSMQFV